MSRNRIGMVLVDPWLCLACGCLNYPNADHCWNCNADTGGTVPEPKIVTEHICPPIPIRQFDWCAHYDDPEGPCGYGCTEAEAIQDLKENVNA